MMMRFACYVALLGALSQSGCGPKRPEVASVEEVALSESGVELTESSLSLGQDDWPGWRGPSQMGVASEQDLPATWDQSTNVLWKSDIPGRGHGSPIVVADSVFLAIAIDSDQRQAVLAFDRHDGNLLWDKTIHSGGFPSASEIHKKGTNANGTLASDGERLYATFFNSGKIIATALDMTGELIWQHDAGSFGSKFGYAPSPVLYKSFVIVAADNWGSGYIAALDSATGEIAWRISRGATSSYSSPLVTSIGERDQLVISGCGGVTSYDPETGDKLWHTPCISEATCGTVITDGARIFASGGYPDKETVCLSANGEKLWSNSTKIYEPSMVVSDGHLFAVSDDGIAYCWDTDTGEANWRERLGGNFSASPLLSGDNIYASNLAGETFVFKANAESYQQVAKNQLGSDQYASPAVSGGRIFVRIGTGQGRSRVESLVCIAKNGS